MKLLPSSNKQAGFTLVELTVTLVVTMVITIAAVVFMVSGLRTYSAASIKAGMLAQAQNGVQRISDDIMLSASADVHNRVDDANSPVSGDPNGWTSNSGTLVLATASVNKSNNIIYADPAKYTSKKDNVIYYLNNGVLYRRTIANADTTNKAKTTCPANKVTASCPADSRVLDSVSSFSVAYRNHLNQTVSPDEARSVEVSITMQSKTYKEAHVSYKARTVFRND